MSKVLIDVSKLLIIFGFVLLFDFAAAQDNRDKMSKTSNKKVLSKPSAEIDEPVVSGENPFRPPSNSVKVSQNNSSSPAAVNQTTPPISVTNTTSTKNELEVAEQTWKSVCGAAPNSDECKRAEAVYNNKSGLTQVCNDAKTALSSAAKDLGEKCSKNAAAGGVGNCIETVSGCLKLRTENEKVKPISTLDGELYYPPDKACEMFKECPALAAGRLKGWEKFGSESREKRTKAQNDILEAKSRENDVQVRMMQDLQEKQKELQAIQNEKQQISSNKSIQEANLDTQSQAEIDQLRQVIVQGEFEQEKITSDQEAAVVEYKNALSKIDSTCKTSANERLRKTLDTTQNMGGLLATASYKQRYANYKRRIEDYDCSQPSVVQERATAQSVFSARMNNFQRRYQGVAEQIRLQRQSYQSLAQKFIKQKQAVLAQTMTQMDKLSSQETQLFTEMARLSSEMKNKSEIAMQKRVNAEQQYHELEQISALNKSNRSCASEINSTAGENASPIAAAGLVTDFHNVSEAVCTAHGACNLVKQPITLPFPKSSISKLGEAAASAELGEFFGNYSKDCITKPDDSNNDRNTASVTPAPSAKKLPPPQRANTKSIQ